MPESYREHLDDASRTDRNRIRRREQQIEMLQQDEWSAEDRSRIDKLRDAMHTLKIQWAEIRIAQLDDQRRMLRGQLAVIGYLRTQPAPGEKDQILEEVYPT